MIIQVNENSTEPLFQQIASRIRRAIATGEVRVGDRLPTARELADSLAVNMHTVLRALSELRDEGLVQMRRGRGVTVAGDGKLAKLRQQARSFIAEARRQGLSLKEIHELLEEYI